MNTEQTKIEKQFLYILNYLILDVMYKQIIKIFKININFMHNFKDLEMMMCL